MTPKVSLLREKDASGASLYLLENAQLRVSLSSLGAAIRSVQVLAPGNSWLEITQGFDDELAWLTNKPYFGVTVGRVANRLAQARFSLGPERYQLEANDGRNHLHGGSAGFHTKVWKADLWQRSDLAGVTFSLNSPDGDQGYPGALEVTCRISLDGENALKTVFEAHCDQPTPINLTNHTYFNLGGPNHPQILDHLFTTAATHVVDSDAELIPTGVLIPVGATAFDFRSPKPIGQDLHQVGLGYDHCFVVQTENKPLVVPTEVAKVQHLASGRSLKLFTDQSGFQFYTGNFLAGTVGRQGRSLPAHAAFCLESQRFPDTPNHPQWAPITVDPAKPYRHEFHYVFGLS